MRPVCRLSEKVSDLSMALYHLRTVELHSPVAAKSGAKRVLAELRALKLEEEKKQ